VGDPDAYSNPRLSPDGTKLAVAVGEFSRGATDIWVFDLMHGGKTRLTFEPVLNYQPVWSPDSSQIIFASNRKGGFSQLYRKAANGEGGDESLLDSNTTDRPDDWSPDGRFIMYEPNMSLASLWLAPVRRAQACGFPWRGSRDSPRRGSLLTRWKVVGFCGVFDGKTRSLHDPVSG
jgi:dipeptidyl aminopeptidase/acylaminoacyl peptidase